MGVSGVLAVSRDLDELRDLLREEVAALVGRVSPGILEGDFTGEFGDPGPVVRSYYRLWYILWTQ